MKAVNVSLEVIQTVMEFTENPILPAQQIVILLYVLDRKEMPMADLAKLVGIAQSSISRNVALLGRGLTPLTPGYGLLEAYEDPFYRRRKLVKLTPRGEALREEMQKLTDRYCLPPKKGEKQ